MPIPIFTRLRAYLSQRIYLLGGILCLFASLTLVANATLTVSNTGLSGDADVSVDGAGTLNLGTGSSTAITIGQAGIPVTVPGNLSVNGTLTLGAASTTAGQLLFQNAANDFTTLLQASSSQSANLTFTLPPTAGTAGQALLTDGTGTLYFGDSGASQWVSGENGEISYTGGNVTIGTMVLPLPAPVPTLDASSVTIASGEHKNAAWLSADRSTLFSFRANGLYRSTDDGATWSAALHTFDTSVAGVRDLANGELLVSTYGNGVDTPGQLWLSSGYPQMGANATWTKVLDAGDAPARPNARFHGLWGMSAHKNIVVVSEYSSISADYSQWSRYAYISQDYGATWTKIFDIGVPTPEARKHVHGIAYDPWWDAIWLVTGETTTEQSSVRVSWDRGANWTVVAMGKQAATFVAVIPLPNCILFLTDGQPNGVHRIPRSANRSVSAPVLAYALNNSTDLTHVGSMPFRAAGVDMPVLLPFIASHGPGVVLSTYDGYNFSTLWTDTQSYDNKGPLTMLGPTVGGKYVGTLSDDRQTPLSRLVIPAPPMPATDGLAVERDAAIAAAIARQSGMVSGYYYTAPAAGTVASLARSNATLYAIPIYISRALTLDRIGLEVTEAGSAGSVIRLGVYGSTATGGFGSLLLDAGTIDGTQVGFQEITIALPVNPGTYWLVAAPQGSPETQPKMQCSQGQQPYLGWSTASTVSAGSALVGYIRSSIAGALPAATGLSGTTGAAPRVLVRVQ